MWSRLLGFLPRAAESKGRKPVTTQDERPYRIVEQASGVALIEGDDHWLGAAAPKVTFLEYGEFECPHCGRAHIHLKALRDRLPELGTRFVFRHLARDDVHPFSVRAAVAAEAAGEQGLFWEMHDHLFENQHSLEYEDLERHAAAVGLDVGRFLDDMRDPRHLERVRAQRESAIGMGVTGTPAFFINGEPYEGGYDLSSLVNALASA